MKKFLIGAALAAAASGTGTSQPVNADVATAQAPAAPTPVVSDEGAAQAAAPAPSAPAPVVSSEATAASDVGSSAGPLLWRNIASGMTVQQLRSLYPQGANVAYKDDRTVLSDVAILEGCQAKVNVMHEAGVVKEIVMRGEGAIAGRCSLKLIAALSGKYGQPLEKDKVRGSLFAREGKNYVWTREGVTLQFKRYTNGPLGGGGLLAASWEMRYIATASNIDL